MPIALALMLAQLGVSSLFYDSSMAGICLFVRMFCIGVYMIFGSMPASCLHTCLFYSGRFFFSVYMCAAPWLALYSFLKCQTVNIDNAQCAHSEGGRHFMCMNAFTSIQKNTKQKQQLQRGKKIFSLQCAINIAQIVFSFSFSIDRNQTHL